jgi:CBS-domain-containing membrane protein
MIRKPNTILTARDLMVTDLLSFHPDQGLLEAIDRLLTRGVRGGPVIDDADQLVGVLSELDCLRMLASDDFYQGDQAEGGCVRQFMSPVGRTISPDMGAYAMAHYFLTEPLGRLLVVEHGRLLGQVSPRDVLRGVERMGRSRYARQRYPAAYVHPV